MIGLQRTLVRLMSVVFSSDHLSLNYQTVWNWLKLFLTRCPTKSYPGLWEVGMIMLEGKVAVRWLGFQRARLIIRLWLPMSVAFWAITTLPDCSQTDSNFLEQIFAVAVAVWRTRVRIHRPRRRCSRCCWKTSTDITSRTRLRSEFSTTAPGSIRVSRLAHCLKKFQTERFILNACWIKFNELSLKIFVLKLISLAFR